MVRIPERPPRRPGIAEGWARRGAQRLGRALADAVDGGLLPGGAAVVGTRDTQHHVGVGGLTSALPGVATGSQVLYDAASLTKVMATWPLVGHAHHAGLLDLDAPVGPHFPGAAEPHGGPRPGDAVTPRQILTHTSRLDPVTGFERYVGSGRDLAEAILSEPRQASGGRYIDRGFILLGLLLERLHGRPLDRLAAELWAAIGLSETTFGPVSRGADSAPTERRLEGAAPTWGVVHDESAALMGGVAGHAGVFTTASELGRFARSVLMSLQGGGPLVPTAFARESAVVHEPFARGGGQGLAWLVEADGMLHHSGYTGTYLAVAPEADRFAGLLTNAVHHGRARVGLDELRSVARKVVRS